MSRKRGRFTPSRREVLTVLDAINRPSVPRENFDPMTRLQVREEWNAKYNRPPCAKAKCHSFADAEVFILLPLPETPPLPLCTTHVRLFSAVMILTGLGCWTGCYVPLRLGFNTLPGGVYDDGKIDL